MFLICFICISENVTHCWKICFRYYENQKNEKTKSNNQNLIKEFLKTCIKSKKATYIQQESTSKNYLNWLPFHEFFTTL